MDSLEKNPSKVLSSRHNSRISFSSATIMGYRPGKLVEFGPGRHKSLSRALKDRYFVQERAPGQNHTLE